MFLFFVLLFGSIITPDEIIDARFPAVSPDGNEIVFCWRGKLWQSSISGGSPRCLTPGEGYVSNPSYSENGELIAFTSDITGGGDVFVMSASGGSSTRLTYHSGEDLILGWSSDKILFTSSRDGGSNWLYSISRNGGTPELILSAPVRNIVIGIDGDYVIETGNTAWWRRHYAGSASSSLWNVRNNQYSELNPLPSDQRWPLLASDNSIIYVMEDSSGLDRFYNTAGNAISEALEGGITYPSVNSAGSIIVFESAGKLFKTSFPEMNMEEIYLTASVDLPSPNEVLSLAGIYTTDFAVASDASFIVMEAEGEIYAATFTDGDLNDAVRITETDAFESYPRISSDGSMVLFQREKDGEVGIVIGHIEIVDDKQIEISCFELNTGREVSRNPEWAPSGDFSFLDSRGCLFVMDMLTEQSTQISQESNILHHSWSPDSRWIAFSKPIEAHKEDVFVISARGGDAINVSRHPNDDFQPEWPSDGRRLIWASRTEDGKYSIVQAWFSEEDWEADRETREQLLDEPLENVLVETDDLYRRTEELCLVEGYYDFFGITPDGKTIYFPAHDTEGGMDLYSVGWDGENETRESYGNLSPTRIQPTDTETAGDVYFLSYSSTIRSSAGTICSWSAPFSMYRDEMQRQKFCSAWRQLRDSFYDIDMHGVDWNEMREKYEERAASAINNYEFNDIVSRMLGELSASHLGIYGPWSFNRIAYAGELGIYPDYSYNGAGIKIDSILPASPVDLSEIQPGDIITAIAGLPVSSVSNFYAPLRNTIGREIEIEYIHNGDAYFERITPVSGWNIWKLQYTEWLSTKRRIVSDISNDRVGYLHIPQMNQISVSNFRRDLYAEGLDRDAMIIDVRGNGGGSTHDQILSSLARESYAMSQAREGAVSIEPLGVWKKPLVLLIDETCYSDAEIFPAAWKELELGPVVGNTTFGAVIGTTDINLVDGTSFRLPGTGWFSLNGSNLENNGVEPDIFVLQLPGDAGEGLDRQLIEAVQIAIGLTE